jgi:hypothetical protein
MFGSVGRSPAQGLCQVGVDFLLLLRSAAENLHQVKIKSGLWRSQVQSGVHMHHHSAIWCVIHTYFLVRRAFEYARGVGGTGLAIISMC